ncbi:hypothetical protein LMH87_003679 [Akanthomyces muscarius]|uniref:Uncharacterized protein n=1 Tax=Akanthomyces muscarius TaxID=2231603 RepID=A0A9W8UHB6_AKAMU|nr:hypothetical protein LMH87_003679 [Akanthomyces muscarius]KAJ4144809.1 hypothetical protein LMH87_003679 [Akanthomyces muscarius]
MRTTVAEPRHRVEADTGLWVGIKCDLDGSEFDPGYFESNVYTHSITGTWCYLKRLYRTKQNSASLIESQRNREEC